MESATFVLFILFGCLIISISEATYYKSKLWTCKALTSIEERCFNPPVFKDVDLTAYTGRWHQVYTSGDATRVSPNDCVTANYSILSTSPLRIDVVNCFFQISDMPARPSCVRADGSRRPGSQFASQLQVRFFPNIPTGNYSIAALVGNANYGYFAAAVYGCRQTRNGSLEDGFFFIARTPYAPQVTFVNLAKKLLCMGYPINVKDFTKTNNSEKCKYFNGPDGFDLIPADPMV